MTRDDLALGRAERVLVSLPRREARRDHAERLRARCHEQLARRTRTRPRVRPALGRLARASVRAALVRARALASLVATARRAFRPSHAAARPPLPIYDRW